MPRPDQGAEKTLARPTGPAGGTRAGGKQASSTPTTGGCNTAPLAGALSAEANDDVLAVTRLVQQLAEAASIRLPAHGDADAVQELHKTLQLKLSGIVQETLAEALSRGDLPDAVASKIAPVEAGVAALHRRLDAAEQAAAALGDRVQAAEESAAALGVRLGNMQTHMQHHTELFNNVRRSSADAVGQAAKAAQEVQTVTTKLNQLQRQVQQLAQAGRPREGEHEAPEARQVVVRIRSEALAGRSDSETLQLGRAAVELAAQATKELVSAARLLRKDGAGAIILVTVHDAAVRRAALQGKRRLMATPAFTQVYIDEALTPAQLRLKAAYFKHYAAELKAMREAGNPAAWRGGVPHTYEPPTREGARGRLVPFEAPPPTASDSGVPPPSDRPASSMTADGP